MAEADQSLLLSTDDRKITTIRFNRPESLNSLLPSMVERITQIVRDAQSTSRAIIITGGDTSFSSGADLTGGGIDEAPGDNTMDAINEHIAALIDSPVPTIAAVEGAAAGVGCSIALACDYVVMTEQSYLMLAFAKIGLMPDGGASALVAASAGRHRALQMALTAQKVRGPQALDWGLANEVVTPGGALDRAAEVAAGFARTAPLALAATRRAINAASLVELPRALAREGEEQIKLLHSEDFAEGQAAFAAKRPPQFTGR